MNHLNPLADIIFGPKPSLDTTVYLSDYINLLNTLEAEHGNVPIYRGDINSNATPALVPVASRLNAGDQPGMPRRFYHDGDDPSGKGEVVVRI